MKKRGEQVLYAKVLIAALGWLAKKQSDTIGLVCR